MLVASAITVLRQQLQDTAGTARYSDAYLKVYLDRGQQQVVSDHADSLCTDTAIVTTKPAETAIADGAESLAVNAHYTAPVIHYAAFLVYQEDSEDTGSGKKAADQFNLYRRGVEHGR
jgi:hypothetical protein